MKIFQTVQMHLALMGYGANRPIININTIGEILQRTLAIICQFVYLIRHANSPKDIIDNLFMTAVAILAIISFTSTLLKKTTIFNFIDDVEKIVNESEFNIAHSNDWWRRKTFE